MTNTADLREVETPYEMRAEMRRARLHDPLVNQALAMADMHMLSDTDRYTLLAYHAVKAKIQLTEQLFHELQNRKPAPIILTKKEMTPEQRVELFRTVSDGYCVKCGAESNGRLCHCDNDE